MRELLARHERATRAMIAGLDANTERIRAGTRALRELTDEFTAQMTAQRDEFVAESRAGRAALFRILDRLDEGGAASGA